MKRMIIAAMALFVLISLTASASAQTRARRVAATAPVVPVTVPQPQAQPVVVDEKIPVYIDVKRPLQNQTGVEEFIDGYIAANAPQYEVVAERREAEFALEAYQAMPDTVIQNGYDPRQAAYNEALRRGQAEVYYRSRNRLGYILGNIFVGSAAGFEQTPYYRDITAKVDIMVRLVPLHTADRVRQVRGTDIYLLRQKQYYGGRYVVTLIGGGDLTQIGLDPKTDLSGFERYFLGILSLKRQLDLLFH